MDNDPAQHPTPDPDQPAARTYTADQLVALGERDPDGSKLAAAANATTAHVRHEAMRARQGADSTVPDASTPTAPPAAQNGSQEHAPPTPQELMAAAMDLLRQQGTLPDEVAAPSSGAEVGSRTPPAPPAELEHPTVVLFGNTYRRADDLSMVSWWIAEGARHEVQGSTVGGVGCAQAAMYALVHEDDQPRLQREASQYRGNVQDRLNEIMDVALPAAEGGPT